MLGLKFFELSPGSIVLLGVSSSKVHVSSGSHATSQNSPLNKFSINIRLRTNTFPSTDVTSTDWMSLMTSKQVRNISVSLQQHVTTINWSRVELCWGKGEGCYSEGVGVSWTSFSHFVLSLPRICSITRVSFVLLVTSLSWDETRTRSDVTDKLHILLAKTGFS